MNFNDIDACIQEKSLLKHPFYQAWSMGRLTKDDLKSYAAQYYHLESAFPRLLSRIHSSCENPRARQAILENLNDEERGAENHRELWLRFAEGLGLSRDEVLRAEANEKTRACINELMELAANSNPAVGLAALYAYESQLPEISKTKIEGLKKFYGFEDSRAIRFFEVHKEMDAWHSKQERDIIAASGTPVEEIRKSATRACSALWTFLDGVEQTRLKACATA